MEKMTRLTKMTEEELPVVEFKNGRSEVIIPHEFKADIFGMGSCHRSQLPLKLAWAMTIHKCQGLTLDHAIVSLSNMFAEGRCDINISFGTHE